MLKLGQEVFTVCRLGLAPFKPPYRYKIYISRKAIVAMELNRNPVASLVNPMDVIYTAGNRDELRFTECVGGSFISIGQIVKPVFLTYEEAKAEKDIQIAKEKARRAKYFPPRDWSKSDDVVDENSANAVTEGADNRREDGRIVEHNNRDGD